MFHDDEEKRLLAQLKKLDDEENERLRMLEYYEEPVEVPEPIPVPQQPIYDYYEHFADGEVDLNGVNEEEFDRKCRELFSQNPIPFVPQKGDNYKLEKEIERLIKKQNITIPIIHVKG